MKSHRNIGDDLEGGAVLPARLGTSTSRLSGSAEAGERTLSPTQFVQTAASGSVLVALGGLYYFSDALTREARAQTRPDGRPRLPPGQRVIAKLKPMGGQAGDPNPSNYRFRVHGEVENPFSLSFAELLAFKPVEQTVDVHCVTSWSVLDARFKGTVLRDLLEKAKPKGSARYLIFEAAHDYTANVPLREAMKPNVLVAHRLDGAPLARAHGSPVRAVVPDLYFWKSAKWLTGVRLVARDEPGYWEQRGYHNYADPWKEQRYA